MRAVFISLRELLIVFFAWLFVAPAIVNAQAAPYPVPVQPSWFSNTPAPSYFPTAEAACQRQWQYYNPNAIFLGTGPISPNFTGCRWDSSPINANTIQPGGVWMTCSAGTVLNLSLIHI